MPVVVDTDTVEHPRTVACDGVSISNRSPHISPHLLVVLGHAALAPLAVLASKRRPDHTRDAKVGLVVLPLLEQLVDGGALLGDAVQPGHESGVASDARDEEKRGQTEQGGEDQVQDIVRRAVGSRVAPSRDGQSEAEPVDADEKEGAGKDAGHPWLLGDISTGTLQVQLSSSSRLSALTVL